jgi:hypothetical protein
MIGKCTLFATGNSAGKSFGEARDWAGIFGDNGEFRVTETGLSGDSGGKVGKVKDYSDRARKPELRRTARWSW